jgi:nucleoside-diphosphate-sugar epimerase
MAAILVTGGTGDVGKEVVKQLAAEGIDSVAFDVAPRVERVQDESGRISVVKGNALNLSEVITAIRDKNVTTVAHLAAFLTGETDARPFEAAHVNMLGTATVLEACRLTNVKRFIYTSTSSVYGISHPTDIINEDYPKKPMNIYGSLKYSSELYSNSFTKKYGIEYAACRLRLIFGPGQRRDTGVMHVLGLGEIIDELIARKEAVFGTAPETKIEATHPSDAAQGVRLACLAKELRSNAYNIMTGSYKISEIAKALESAIPGSHVKFDTSKGELRVGPGTRFGNYDISRAKSELGYNPKYNINVMIREIVEYETKKSTH